MLPRMGKVCLCYRLSHIEFIDNPLISKLFSTVLNEEGYSYGIDRPINLQLLHVGKPWISAFKGKKTNISILFGSNFIAKGI
jgi:hypothetical protein